MVTDLEGHLDLRVIDQDLVIEKDTVAVLHVEHQENLVRRVELLLNISLNFGHLVQGQVLAVEEVDLVEVEVVVMGLALDLQDFKSKNGGMFTDIEGVLVFTPFLYLTKSKCAISFTKEMILE